MTSILTNNGAMVALQTLKGINKNMGDVQSQIATGMKVATAKDNASSWAIASTMNSDVRVANKLSENLNSASSMVGTARNAAEQIAEKLKEVQEKVVQGTQSGADIGKLQADVTGLTETILSIAKGAQFNGINLVKGMPDTANITMAVNRDGAGALAVESFAVAGVDLEVLGAALVIGTATPDDIDTLIDTANTAAATFGAAQNRIESQNEFITKQADSLKAGVGALVDANMEEASARLQALQVQQQLGTQALSIANQAPQSVMSLFR